MVESEGVGGRVHERERSAMEAAAEVMAWPTGRERGELSDGGCR